MEDAQSAVAGLSIELAKTNVRLKNVEDKLEHNETLANTVQELALAVGKLAGNVESTLRELERQRQEQIDQGKRIRVLETEPAASWKTIKKTAVTTAVSTIAGAAVIAFIVIIAQYLG